MRASMRGERVVVAGIGNKVVAALLRFLPRRLVLAATAHSRRPASADALHWLHGGRAADGFELVGQTRILD